MDSRQQALITFTEECILLCRELIRILQVERKAVIEFETETLIQSNFEKEKTLAQLTEKRTAFRNAKADLCGNHEVEDVISENLMPMWLIVKKEWIQTWEELRSLCENNHGFIRHSVRNLDLILEHLKKSLGIHSIYTAKGTKIDNQPQGNVVQGRY
jgi:hypothetical protein